MDIPLFEELFIFFVFGLAQTKPGNLGLLPVTCVIVRCGNTSYLKTCISVDGLTISVKVDSKLIVESFEERPVRHPCFE